MRTSGMAQEVEPPFTWEGKGTVWFISEDGISKIKHIFYTDAKPYEYPGFFSRNLVIVLILNEYGNNPMLTVLNGRLLVDKFFYGEAMLTRYEEGSDTAKALGVGNPEATWMEEDELPGSVKSTLKKCIPFGMVKIEGDYKTMVRHESTDGDTISLFNGTDLDGWHMWLEKADADPKDVWKVKDGVITCKGDTIEASVNGQLQNRVTGVNINTGYIGLQSEGVPIMFRNIKLTLLR